jgi:hypothetical protein
MIGISTVKDVVSDNQILLDELNRMQLLVEGKIMLWLEIKLHATSPSTNQNPAHVTNHLSSSIVLQHTEGKENHSHSYNVTKYPPRGSTVKSTSAVSSNRQLSSSLSKKNDKNQIPTIMIGLPTTGKDVDTTFLDELNRIELLETGNITSQLSKTLHAIESSPIVLLKSTIKGKIALVPTAIDTANKRRVHSSTSTMSSPVIHYQSPEPYHVSTSTVTSKSSRQPRKKSPSCVSTHVKDCSEWTHMATPTVPPERGRPSTHANHRVHPTTLTTMLSTASSERRSHLLTPTSTSISSVTTTKEENGITDETAKLPGDSDAMKRLLAIFQIQQRDIHAQGDVLSTLASRVNHFLRGTAWLDKAPASKENNSNNQACVTLGSSIILRNHTALMAMRLGAEIQNNQKMALDSQVTQDGNTIHNESLSSTSTSVTPSHATSPGTLRSATSDTSPQRQATSTNVSCTTPLVNAQEAGTAPQRDFIVTRTADGITLTRPRNNDRHTNNKV